MLVELVLTAARRAERALGPGAAIAMVSAALDATTGTERRTLLLAGLGAAARASDRAAFGVLAARWAASEPGDDGRGLSLVARLVEAGHEDLARRLARAELDRVRSATALFALAALSEPGAAGELFAEAARDHQDGALADRARRASLAHGSIDHADAADAALTGAHDVSEVLRLAPIALGSPRLYARVRALDRLAELLASEATRLPALRIALAHADLRGARLGTLERDRVLAIATLAGARPSIDALEGRAAAPIAERVASEALMGRPPETEHADRAITMALRAISAVVSEDRSGTLLLSALAAHPPSPVAWTAAITGLAHSSTRAAACGCIERWSDHGVAPPRGFSLLADSLVRTGASELAERAMTQAVRANEPGARTRLAAALARRARAAYDVGDRHAAKSLLERSLAIDPDVA